MAAERRFSVGLVAGNAHPCPYLPDRESLLHFVDPAIPLDAVLYGALLAQGFRRSGPFVYRPACPACRQCMPLRLPVALFSPDRSQRRSRKANSDLSVEVAPARVTDEHFELYRRYIAARHPDGAMEKPTAESCNEFLLADWCRTRFIDLRLHRRLVATAVTDITDNAASAVYTFYEPDLERRSLGSFAVTVQAELAASWGLEHLYLGYWIERSGKMAYKTRFRPHELFREGVWMTP